LKGFQGIVGGGEGETASEIRKRETSGNRLIEIIKNHPLSRGE